MHNKRWMRRSGTADPSESVFAGEFQNRREIWHLQLGRHFEVDINLPFMLQVVSGCWMLVLEALLASFTSAGSHVFLVA